MKYHRLVCGSTLALLMLSCLAARSATAEPLDLPWREAGWSEAQAAAHLLDRLTYGPTPGLVEDILQAGLESWLEDQLEADLPDRELEGRLEILSGLDLEVREYPEVYPNPGLVLSQARAAGVVPEDFDPQNASAGSDRRLVRRQLIDWARGQGYESQRVLVGELLTQKLYRAVYSENQLAEVLADFWFNHFNVSLTDNQARVYVLSYERDAIRPHVLGGFPVMLEATAKHPAMLLYLDNAQSTANPGATTTMEQAMVDRAGRRGRQAARRAGRRPPQGQNRPRGLNENYARELLELHTLGVDGGYSQEDVVEAARSFSGWTIYPPTFLRQQVGARLDRALASGTGFVARDGFLFRADAHDAGPKRVLGHSLPQGRGIEDGEEVLRIVARHPSTADHLARKLASRFVADDPPEELVERLATTFRESGGDLEAVMVALLESPEFWSDAARRAKIKSPFELMVSALRALDAEIERPRQTVKWIERMGQPLYAYQAPTGYPDRADYWVNTGALLNRMNFSLALAAGDIDGVKFDLAALNEDKEPESRIAALETYVPILMPQREPAETVSLLEPMVLDPQWSGKVEKAAPETEAGPEIFGADEPDLTGEVPPDPPGRSSLEPSALARVVGVILGSPEFQRK